MTTGSTTTKLMPNATGIFHTSRQFLPSCRQRTQLITKDVSTPSEKIVAHAPFMAVVFAITPPRLMSVPEARKSQ
jgi:hypothetical protein